MHLILCVPLYHFDLCIPPYFRPKKLQTFLSGNLFWICAFHHIVDCKCYLSFLHILYHLYCSAGLCAWEKEAFTVTGISRPNVFIPGRSGQLRPLTYISVPSSSSFTLFITFCSYLDLCLSLLLYF